MTTPEIDEAIEDLRGAVYRGIVNIRTAIRSSTVSHDIGACMNAMSEKDFLTCLYGGVSASDRKALIAAARRPAGRVL